MRTKTTARERRLWMRLRDRYELIALMTQRGLSCRELAHWAHCSHQMISFLRTGRLSTCRPELAARIEKALAVQPGHLFESRTSSSAPSTSSASRTAERRGAA